MVTVQGSGELDVDDGEWMVKRYSRVGGDVHRKVALYDAPGEGSPCHTCCLHIMSEELSFVFCFFVFWGGWRAPPQKNGRKHSILLL